MRTVATGVCLSIRSGRGQLVCLCPLVTTVSQAKPAEPFGFVDDVMFAHNGPVARPQKTTNITAEIPKRLRTGVKSVVNMIACCVCIDGGLVQGG